MWRSATQLDVVLSGAAAHITFETSFLSNEGKVVAVRGAAARLAGAYGSEGAVIVVTRA